MTIRYDHASQTFHLQSQSTSYIIQVHPDGFLMHRYFGPALTAAALSQPRIAVGRAFAPNPNPQRPDVSADTLPLEYPGYGASDFRVPACEIRLQDGSSVCDLRYAGHRIMAGKPALTGLPATYVEDGSEADTLILELVDQRAGLKVELSYTAFTAHAAIARSARVINEGEQEIELRRVMSVALDVPDADYNLVHLSGAWAREREQVTRTLTPGTHTIESRRGASSHQQNPFVALARKDATETSGDVIAVSLVYSGNFLAGAEVDQYQSTRVFAGINPFDFSWLLAPGESFQAPEAVLVFSAQGWGELSRTYHRLYRTRLARGRYRDAVRPVLINNWEATYFQFDADILATLGHLAGELGVELFVLDDGWFGRRDNDNSSLGDWVVDTRKLPDGLAAVARRMNASGLQFGLWFEPEMVSPDSDLYRAHPDWCLHVADRNRTQARNQLVLDFSRAQVCDAITDMLRKVLQSAPIRYVKWDMNRHMTEIGSAGLDARRQRETAHRYMLGLYRVLETITSEFPDVLFESCSGGGGRFDPGMLHYMPQVWTSDNTDAIARLPIQFGTSLAYPSSAMGAHVSAVPNHQVGRTTSLNTRGVVAMMGNFGYELDLRALPPDDHATIRAQISFYKQVRCLVQFGDLYRLLWPTNGCDAAWMYVDEARAEALVSFVKVMQRPNPPLARLRLQGLDPAQSYRVRLAGAVESIGGLHDGAVWEAAGDELLHLGVAIPYLHGDYAACTWHLTRV